jgi:hypothetical protein
MAVSLCLFMWVIPLTAQDSLLYRTVTIPDTLCTVETALKIIEHHTGLSFSYNSGLFNKKKFISFNADQERLIDLLPQVFNDVTLNFSIIGRHLVVYKSLKAKAVNPDSKVDSVYYFEIRGRVFDKENRQPLPFTSVYLNGKSTGTISNDDGGFLLKLSSADITQMLTISCIGYKNFTAPVSSLINSDNNYYLKTDVISIQEVIIRRISPALLLQSATEKIKDNYPQQPAVLTSFYRETVQRGNRYMMVSEALIESFKTAYTANSSDQVKILKGRKNEDKSRGDTVMLKLKAGLSAVLMLDVVKNMPDFLTGENIADYNYIMADIVVQGGKDNYSIEFSPKERASSPIYSGRIIIGIQDLAFKWVEFHISSEKLGRATNLFILRKPANLVAKILKADYKVAYRQSGNKYYLYLVQGETEFRIRNRKQLSGSVYKTKIELAVTDIDTLKVGRFPQRETARLHEFFTDQIGSYDESFWGEYNFITPDESLENALVKLSKAQAAREEKSDE